MDSEKQYKIRKKLLTADASPNDEGPYYHHTWWEAYKGSVKGKFGGAIVGTAVGALMGGIVAVTLASFSITIGVVGVAAFAAAGMMYGVHEFSEIGKVTGAIAAYGEHAELRMKEFERGKFEEIKKDLSDIKSAIGKKSEQANGAERVAEKPEEETPYRKSHYAKLSSEERNGRVFWKIAAIGLAIGLGAGLLLSVGGVGSIAYGLMSHALGEAALHTMGSAGVTAISMISFGALGASFGINRDYFRKVFDQTDLWFKGILHHDSVARDQQLAADLVRNGITKPDDSIKTLVLPNAPGNANLDEPTPNSSTNWRDKEVARAQQALLAMDHQHAVRH